MAEKDILKAILDHEVKKLITMIREYGTGKAIYEKKWFEQPYQKGVIDHVKNFKLDVVVKSLITSSSLWSIR